MICATSPPPFIIYATPRSRTAWLSRFLTYGGWRCHHEHAVYLRSVDGLKAFFSQRKVGSVETAAAQGWRILHHHFPKMRAVVIRRPVDEVVASCLAVDMKGEFTYNESSLRKTMEYGHRCLAQVADQPGVLVADFADLEREHVCAAIFEHCLQQPFNRTWWEHMREQNVQMDVPAHIRYFHENLAAVKGFKSAMWREMRSLASSGAIAGRA